MIVVIAPEKDIPNEIEILHQLFQEGLEFYHLRKPNKNFEEFCDYLKQIDEKYHNKIVIHHFHKLINDYNLKGIHFQEQKRIEHINNPGHYFKGLNMYGKTISSSFHEPQELADCHFDFDYHLLSPVFDSISKQGYKGRGFDVNHINKTTIGMGGVSVDNLPTFDTLGYKGVAVLGTIWKSQESVNIFKKIKKHFE